MSATRSAKQGRGHWILVTSVASVPGIALFLAVLRALPVTGGPILDISSDTLTTYRATAKTKVQDARPRVEQRGVNLDGTLRAPIHLPVSIAGNPFEHAWENYEDQNGVRLDTGTWAPTDVDLSLGATVPWIIGRTYNARSENSGQYDSAGPQGYNWFQSSQPEIVLYQGDVGINKCIYLVWGADRYAEFQSVDSNNIEFKGKNGVAGFFYCIIESSL